MPLFGIEHFISGTLGPFAFLPPDLGNPLGILTLPAEDLRFQFIGKHPARPVPVHGLCAFLLALDTEACGPVLQKNARGHFVNVLTPWPSGAHERFLEILLPDPEPLHFVPKTLTRFFRYRIIIHSIFFSGTIVTGTFILS
jgi:hypothetical protein